MAMEDPFNSFPSEDMLDHFRRVALGEICFVQFKIPGKQVAVNFHQLYP